MTNKVQDIKYIYCKIGEIKAGNKWEIEKGKKREIIRKNKFGMQFRIFCFYFTFFFHLKILFSSRHLGSTMETAYSPLPCLQNRNNRQFFVHKVGDSDSVFLAAFKSKRMYKKFF